MNYEKFIKYFSLGMKILTPSVFFVVTCFPSTYYLAGVMVILTLYHYAITWKSKDK